MGTGLSVLYSRRRGSRRLLRRGRLGVVIHLVAVVELGGVELAGTGDGVGAVDALDGALFVLVGVAPRYSLVPVEMGGDGIALAVLLDLKSSLPP